jgi:maleate isomerase
MEREAFRAARELATAGVDCIAYCCTLTGIIQGIDGDKLFCRRLEEETGIPTTSALSAALESLEALRIKNMVLISPYGAATHAAEEQFLQANGFHLVRSQSMGISSRKERTAMTPREIFLFCRENWDENADGLFISCMNFHAMPCIDPLERDLGKPVLSSHAAVLWKVLTMIHLQEPMRGYGRLLAGEIPPEGYTSV